MSHRISKASTYCKIIFSNTERRIVFVTGQILLSLTISKKAQKSNICPHGDQFLKQPVPWASKLKDCLRLLTLTIHQAFLLLTVELVPCSKHKAAVSDLCAGQVFPKGLSPWVMARGLPSHGPSQADESHTVIPTLSGILPRVYFA